MSMNDSGNGVYVGDSTGSSFSAALPSVSFHTAGRMTVAPTSPKADGVSGNYSLVYEVEEFSKSILYTRNYENMGDK